MIKKVWINDRVEEVEVSEEIPPPEIPQEPTEIEMLKQQTADLNLRDIELFEILIEAGLI
jgi:hypothetical protein